MCLASNIHDEPEVFRDRRKIPTPPADSSNMKLIDAVDESISQAAVFESGHMLRVSSGIQHGFSCICAGFPVI